MVIVKPNANPTSCVLHTVKVPLSEYLEHISKTKGSLLKLSKTHWLILLADFTNKITDIGYRNPESLGPQPTSLNAQKFSNLNVLNVHSGYIECAMRQLIPHRSSSDQ